MGCDSLFAAFFEGFPKAVSLRRPFKHGLVFYVAFYGVLKPAVDKRPKLRPRKLWATVLGTGEVSDV